MVDRSKTVDFAATRIINTKYLLIFLLHQKYYFFPSGQKNTDWLKYLLHMNDNFNPGHLIAQSL